MHADQTPFKFRYVNTLAGAFVLLCALLLVAGVFVAGRAQGWFEARIRLIAELTTEDGAYGLQEGAEIRIMDALAGRVGRIEPSEEGILQAELEIRERFTGFINQGSKALVKRTIVGLMGDAYIDISPALSGFEPFESGDRIEISKDVELVETAFKVLDELQVLLIPLVEETRGLLENLNRTTRAIDDGQGTLGMLLRDEQLAADLRGTVGTVHQTAEKLPDLTGQVERSMDQVQQILENVHNLSATADTIVSELASEIDGVRGLIWETTDTVREAGVLLRGLQRHWLLRKHIEAEPAFPLPVPADIGAGGREVLP